ncbi:sugar ABC transporter ATP-binding protein, partial [Curtobacterium flaccumfaciens]|uniref:sugar ABC transporter ATP-binding protein n=1 Tax=Curtobacterium flaccumfaciens TaxID=2035 RepID=UPI001E48169A
SGAEVPDVGSITVDGAAEPFSSPKDAARAGIACVYQELSLIDQLTVAENLFLGTERTSGGMLSRAAMNKRADEVCREYGIPARGTDKIAHLPVAQRQLLEVVRAIEHDAKYLLLDEPTTALEERQVEQLLDVIRRLTTERGIGVLLVDHKLDEVFAVADHVVGLANGRIVLDESVATIDRQAVVDAIVGDHATTAADLVGDDTTPHQDAVAESVPEFGAVVLDVDDLRGNGLNGVSLQVRAGEVLGIYGLIGAGRSRFLRTVYGAEPIAEGRMTLQGESYRPKRPGSAIGRGVAFLSEERKQDGFIPQMSSIDNAVLPILGRSLRAGIINWRALRGSASTVLDQVAIRGDVKNPITSLSGGNQQKALFARATLQAPLLLLLDEPTKGVDIGAKQEIHDIVRTLARDKRVAVIVVSSEEEELTGLADSITVFRGGASDGVIRPKRDVTAAELRELAWGDDAMSASTTH